MPAYRTIDVAVPGGKLRVGIWGERGPAILCSHGVTANHTTFQPLVDRLAALGVDARLIAPDHRGRGRSNAIAGPWGLREHAHDLVRVLDHLRIERADLVVGQSMGGFVAVIAAAEYGARLGPLLLVDGGLPLMDKLPWYLPLPLFMRLVLGPSLRRLGMTFASREAYRDYWRKHPALARDWSPYLERFVDYDLEGEAPALRSGVRREAIDGDTRSMLAEDLVPGALERLPGPVRFLRAPRGLMDAKPLYSEAQVRRWGARIHGFSATTVADVNHYTILMSERGAQAVAEEVRQLLA